MNLVDVYYKKTTIEGMHSDEFKEILQRKNDSVQIKKASNGLLLLSNNKVFKCTKEYYSTDIPLKNSSSCFYVLKNFGLQNKVSISKCDDCHLACLKLKEEGKLKRKSKK